MFSKTPSQLFFPASYGISCAFSFSSSFFFSSSGNGTNDSRRRRLEKLTLDLLLFPGEKNLNLPKQGGFAIPAGSDLFLSVWNLHRDPARWKDADEFIPERFGPVDDVVAVRAGAGCPQSGSPPSPSAASASASSPSSSSYVVPNEITESFSYLPFGGGKRKCIGDQFALFESVTALAIFARRVSL